MSMFLHDPNAATNNAKAVAIPRAFSMKTAEVITSIETHIYKNNWFAIHNHLKTAIVDLFLLFFLFEQKKDWKFRLFNIFYFPWLFSKFPDLEEKTNFPDFSLSSGFPDYL